MLSAIYRYRNPLNTPLTFAGKRLTERSGLLLAYQLGQQTHWGECAPLPGFSFETLADNETALLTDADDLPPAAQFALSSCQWLSQNPVEVSKIRPIPLLVGTPEQMLAKAATLSSAKAKLKLARQPLQQEIELVKQLQRHQPQLKLRIDANRGWSLTEARQFANAVDLAGIDYVEEPCFDLNDSIAVHQQTGLPLALDETTQVPNYKYSPIEGVKALVLKPTLIGSINRLSEIITAANADAVTAVLSSSFESNIGLTTIAKLASVLTPTEAPGIDTLAPLHYDLICANPWIPDRPIMPTEQMEALWP